MLDSQNKTVNVTDSEDLKEKVSDVELFGNPDSWKLICKASSKKEGWLKSTKAMEVSGIGCFVQVTTQSGREVAEALCFQERIRIQENFEEDKETGKKVLVSRELVRN